MNADPPPTDAEVDEPDPEDFDFDFDSNDDAESELDLDGDVDVEPSGPDGPPLRPPPIQWTFRSVLVTALVFALAGFTVGYFVAKPRPPGENSVDVGFMRDMIDHHDQAVEMSLYALAGDANGLTKTVAGDVLLSQRQEIGLMDGILGGWNRRRGDPDRNAMEWMGMGGPVPQMFGMQPRAQIEELRAATGKDIDRLFFTMLREHHQGGVHMAEYAEKHATNKRVRLLATFMANTQRTEINEINVALKRLGLE